VLDALQVPIDSQMMVFVKDSVQMGRISRDNPRALYFNDVVSVGWVRGGFIELASQDPRQGVVFYTLEESMLDVALDTVRRGRPSLARRNDCLSCHHTYSSLGVPGMLNRSVGQFTVTQQLPFEQRWGGWFVTGDHGAAHHLGNAELSHIFDTPFPSGMSNWPSLEGKANVAGYLAPQSDIVALLVFEHQTRMMNLLTRIGWEAEVREYRQHAPPTKAAPATDDLSKQPVPIDQAAREVVDYMLFVDEAPLPRPVRGATTFATRFSTQGPRDKAGRSLRQFDLQQRLFKYPCSYLVYSPQFDQLPPLAKGAIYRRLWQILSGEERGQPYSRLTQGDRAAIIDILRDTKPDLPEYFRSRRSATR